MVKKYYIYILFFLLVAGCKAPEYIKKDVDNISAFSKEIIRKNNKKNIPDYLYINGSELVVNNGERYNVKLRIYSDKSNLIFVSGRYLGFEIFRCKLNRDSVYFINRLKREFLIEKRNDFYSGILGNIKLEDLHNMLYSGWYWEGKRITDRAVKRIIFEDNGYVKRNLDLGRDLEARFTYSYKGSIEYLEINSILNSMFIKIDFLREREKLYKISGLAFLKNKKIEWYIDLAKIDKRKYEKTDFKIGKGYHEIKL